MDSLKEEDKRRAAGDGGGDHRSVVVELPLGEAAANFDLESAVCSHGLFMMAPNFWDPLTKTLQRPLRFDCDDNGEEVSVSSLLVRISHPSDTPLSLHIRVFGTEFLSPQRQQSLLSQVRRMLRLSEYEERNAREFQKMYGGEAKERVVGRVFRSPTLFEDMVKCILFCNCQWSRTLSMARALCELQLELQHPSFNVLVCEAGDGANSRSQTAAKTERFIPKTPAGKESKRKLKGHKSKTNLATRFLEANIETEAEDDATIDCVEMSESLQGTEKLSTNFTSSIKEEDNLNEQCNSCHTSAKNRKADSFSSSDLQSSKETEHYSYNMIGNFPSPRELASLDEKFLQKRCNLGYRASWILNLAQSVVEGRIQLRQLEEACDKPSLSIYNELTEQLKEINGFGPFTRANVLMCMGFYHVIPADTETIRHLKQVHARNCTNQTVQRDVEAIYGKYAPFQFLVYWSEIWNFYEEKFGKLSEMAHSDYRLITAANMRPNKSSKPNTRPNKRSKPDREAHLE
ncbi:uncharacterized protein LOC132299497 [Cornus florida]|uniref:uncharacterized protein LOC132299497 n=1 Tax=Cornus florida TaxID=4283 RepID=UPI0028A1170C|nr:uncharacterized protein LOC132299497 [Cornus florida]